MPSFITASQARLPDLVGGVRATENISVGSLGASRASRNVLIAAINLSGVCLQRSDA
jgi:hypothetical protein